MLGTSWRTFKVIQEGDLMDGMNIFIVASRNDVIPSVPFSGGFKIPPSFGDCDMGIYEVRIKQYAHGYVRCEVDIIGYI
jgi:hypothetical protein